ncbi:zonadhesin-like isoform X5 [Argiope bruennichi]|uniref:zonadhesin-like isoform X5 n=1 Tax=Argiope bruennichi TaxID=94029 RepID=UPI002494DA80|nr:zonadhesin-like isoform X5 [Argiope bruennichi]
MWTLLLLALCSSLQEGMRPSQCQALCSENERFVNNVNPCNTCENHKVCSLSTDGGPGCDCLPGYYRNAEEKCVSKEECEGRSPSTENGVLRWSRPANKIICRKDEVFLECSCEKTCCNGGQAEGCSASCSKGCFCKKGLVRHEDGRCIRLQECEKQNSPGSDTPTIQCSMPRCDAGCSIDYSTKPCPSCSCTNTPTIQCSMPKCDEGCSIDYSTKPCPSCSCTNMPTIQCSMPKCDEGCSIDYSTKPCPSCSCTDSPIIQCSPPKCSSGCSIDYSTKPCPSCSCPNLPSPNNCRPDEQFHECMPLCNGTCSAYLTKSYLFCKMACRSGCFCRKGLYKTEDGRCVPASQCTAPNSPPENNCGANAEYRTCGSACPPTCANRGKKLICTQQCVPGCFCKKGFVKNDQGKCVQPTECQESPPKIQCLPPKCGVGCSIDYSTKPCPSCSCVGPPIIQCSVPKCRAGCSIDYSTKPCPSCSCAGSPPIQCSMPKCDDGCKIDYSTKPCPSCSCTGPPEIQCSIPKCDVGCRIDYSTKPCPSCSCSDSCGENEEFRGCGSACPATCANLGKNVMCTMQCVPGCFCARGLVRNDQGKCVPPEECPQNSVATTGNPSEVCDEDEEYQVCGSGCPPSCKNLGKNLPCTFQCVPGCFCRKGMVRNDEGECVEPEECPQETCGEDEEYRDCGSACPATCSNLGKKQICTQQCVPGCFCREGLVRNEENECVEPEECPENPPKVRCSPPRCGPGCSIDRSTKPCPSCSCPSRGPGDRCDRNRQFYDCIPRCSRTCEAYTRKPKVYCRPLCRSGCFCREGLYEREDGKCVPPTQCPAVPPKKKCPRNEEYSECAIPCNDCETRGKCNFLVCNAGCDCKKGYYRDFNGSNGRCIPAKQCPLIHPTPPADTCESDKQYYECIPSCQRTCSAYRRKEQILCNQICTSGCFCREGLYLADDGVTCVKPEQCLSTPSPPTKKCKKNEVFSKCVNPCNDCQTRGKCNFLVCNEGCDCRKGYYRDFDGSNGRCIPAKQCPLIHPTPAPTECASNQQYYDCIPRCMRTCEAYTRPVEIFCSQLCISGCFCKEGLYESDDGTCVPPEQCPIPATSPEITPSPNQCRADEQFYECIPACQQTCFALTSEVKIACRMPCRSGCYCREGLYQKDDGTCVPPEGCFDTPVSTTAPDAPTSVSTCRKNEEYYRCIPTCRNTCENYQAVKPICSRICIEGCFCKKGLVKRSDGKCVKPEKCRKSSPSMKPTKPMNKICGPDEQFYSCIPTCKNTCENYQAKRPICPRICRRGCFCKKGLVKRRDGKCVKPDKCKSSSPEPTDSPTIECSMPMCGTGCTIDYSTKPCPSCSCPNVPPPTNSVCMQPKEVGPCRALFQRFFYNQQTGQCEAFTYGGCKGNKNNFEKKEDCEMTCGTEPKPAPPKCGKDEQYYKCIPNCQSTCDTYKTNMPCPLFCKSGCYCKEGMVKNRNGKCVKPSECESTNPPVTAAPIPTNSVCLQPKEVGPCLAIIPRFFYNLQTGRCEEFSYGGCAGNKNNFEKKKDCERTCGKSSTPSPSKCGKDEQYYNCVPNCHNTCDTYNLKGPCPLYCMSGCFCKEGMVKNKDGKCVQPSQCPSTNLPSSENSKECGANEEYYDDCAPKCTGTCEAYNNPGIYHCPRCLPGCWCSQGFVKRSDGQCVPPDQCNVPSTPTPSPASNPICQQPKVVGPCRALMPRYFYNQETRQCEQFNYGGCRGNKNNFKTKEECETSCGSGPPDQCGENEEYYEECAPSCGGTCESYKKLPILNCRLCRPGCWCSKGLVKRKDGKCVPKDQCDTPTDVTEIPPHTCREDEEFLPCGSACPPSCSTLGKNNFACIALCVPGCFCKQGLIRNEQGECVKPEDCPQNTCGEDEEYRDCGSACPPTCSDLGRNQICTQQCVPGCFCREGLVRNEEGECVEPEDCPQPTCNEDEEYKECGSSCPPSCSNLGKNIICTKECSPGCFCREGLVRNDEGECVEPEECPQDENPEVTTPAVPTDTCGANEEYKNCGTACPSTCANIGMDRICTLECVPGCFCKKGFVRNDQGQCVEPDDCPQRTCGEDEEYKDCGSACPPTCSNLGKNQVCTDQCVQGCFCKEGLVKNDKGECVEPEECPEKSPEECGENEKYYDCAPSCGGTCDTYNKTAVILCLPCGPGCWCNEGLVKNRKGKCVPPEQCDVPKVPTCPKDQQYYDCIPSCKRTCMTYNSTSAFCPKECIKGCFCKDGLVMNKNGECVPPAECPLTCPLNQKYYECMPDCQNRCNPPDACAAVCKSGCFCKEGLVMREDEKCVRKELCKAKNSGKPQCRSDEEYYDCFQRCRNSCATRKGVCPAVCESGCFCKKGLLLSSQGKCVEADECDDDESKSTEEGSNGSPGSKPDNKPGIDKKCDGMNEEVVPCAKPKTCNTCLIRGNCKLKRCEAGCDCKSGYYRDDSGTCIPQDQCPGATPQCSGENEEIVSCAKPKWCNTCGIRGNCKLKECESGCDCKSGYYRDDNGVCIPQDKCPGDTPQCSGENEEIVSCAKPKWCNTCGIRGNCKLKSCESGCDCKSGYFRDDSGVCIPQDKCPASNPPEDSQPEPGNTIVPGSENDSSVESSYSEESFSSISETQSSESSSTSQSSNIRKRSSSSESWFSDSESGNEIDSEKNSSEELEAEYSSMATIATEGSSDMSSDSEKSSSRSSSESGMWSSGSSSRSERESAENEIDSFDELIVSEDKSSSDSESGYSTMSSDSENWSTNMSSDSEQNSSRSSSGSGMWSSSSSSSSERESAGNEIDSFDESIVSEDKSSSDLESGYSTMSSASEDWSTNMSSDSEQSSSRSSSGSGMWSSSSSSRSKRESAENEIGSSDALTIFEDGSESSSDMESGYSTMSSASESWSADASDDSKMSSSSSSSGSRMWSSKISSDFESDEEEQENYDEVIYVDDGNGFEEYFYSWTEVEGNDEN